ncbi:hypothetical protein MNV49_001220 [Pseudohyphozyma bogoriensis]|nr:hypothetical protein MNV49_001220 [Pseudohyphozyma bogoriensis]
MKSLDTSTFASPPLTPPISDEGSPPAAGPKSDNQAVPTYDELPEAVPGFPCSWEYFNTLVTEEGAKDQLGTLNFLSPARVTAARNEIRTGKTVSLNLSLNELAQDMSAFGGRKPPTHEIMAGMPNGREDSVNFNTQVSSHWDGLRHFGFFHHNLFYQGYTPDDLANSNVIGVHSWAERGGIVGRGVLVDYLAWITAKGEDPGVNSGRAISLTDVLAILAFQQTTVQPGDVLIFRTGWMQWYKETAPDIRHDNLCIKHAPGAHAFVGLEASREFVAWLWDNQISAVAGDQPAFEVTPPPAIGTTGWLHEHLLAALGCPMGELWDVELLGEECRKQERYSFFFSSMPLNIPGGVASPLNGTAIF